MDREDREHFRTIHDPSAGRYGSNERQAASSSALDQASCERLAETICGCYRRDEAQNPDVFAAALKAVLMDYPADIARYAADPRTGVVSAFPMGLPNVGQIRQFLEDQQARKDRLQHYSSLPKVERRQIPRAQPGPGAFANVFVPAGTPIYPRFVERAKTADNREYRYEQGKDGIFVALGWFDGPAFGSTRLKSGGRETEARVTAQELEETAPLS
jgi:hypothetical protein